MATLSNKVKKQLFNDLISESNVFGDEGEDREIYEFCSLIWDLDSMPSTDGRFKNASGDIYQHIVNNSDWDLEYLFISRLDLLSDDRIYIRFLETIISPEIRSEEKKIIRFVLLINSFIEAH